MGKVKNLSWTPKQLEIKEFLLKGLSPQDIIAKGYSKTMVSRVKLELGKLGIKLGNVAEEVKQVVKQASQLGPHLSTQGQSTIRPRVLESINVGEILIEPADWRINQYGGLLILGTYEHARRILNYGGTVGDFLCDITQLIRLMMGLDMVATDYLIHAKEDDNGRTTSSGPGVSAEVREDSAGAVESGSEQAGV